MKINRRILPKQVTFALMIAIWALPAVSQIADKASRAKENDAASLTEIQAALTREPRNPKLYIKLGQVYWDRNDYQHAFDAFQQAVKVGPVSAETHNWLGAFLISRGNLPGAISELRKAVSLDQKYPRAYTNLGSALAQSGDLSEAVAAFQKALALEPNSWAAHLNLGIALRDKGDTEGALVHLRHVAKAQPKNAAIQCELGQTLRQSGDLAAAAAALDRALEIDPEMREAYYGLGSTLKQQGAAARRPSPEPASPGDEFYKRAQEAVANGDLSFAKEQLFEALRADENHGEAHGLLGYLLGQEGDLASALPQLERAVSLRDDSADAHYSYGAALWFSGSKDKAVSELQKSVRLDPGASASYALLGMALRETGDLAASQLNLKRAIALSPATAATFIDLGIVFLRQGELDRALAQFKAGLNAASSLPAPDWDAAIIGLRELISKNPGRPEAHNMLGLLLGRKGADSNEVLSELREAVRLRPDYAEAHNNMGLVLAQNDDDEKAIAEFREAVHLQPDYADTHANLGAALMFSDVDQAIAELEKAVSLDPTQVKAEVNLAEAYGRSPSHGPAKQIEQLRKVISLAPDFARAHLALGKTLLQDGKVADAVSELQEATRLDPRSGEAHYQLGLALARTGKQQEATAEVQKGRELSAADERNQNANLDVSEGRSALEKGELQEAEAKFRHAIRLEPTSPSAQHYLAIVLEKEGDREGAIAAYQKAADLNPGDLSSKQSLNRLSASDRVTESAKVATVGDDAAKVSELEGYFRDSRFKEVEPLLAGYVKEHPGSSWGWYALGYSQFAQKKIGESIKSLAESLRLNVEDADAHKILGRDLMIVGRFDMAQAEFEQGIHYAPKSPENYYDLGKLFSLQDNWEGARKQFEDTIRLDPSYIEAIDALGFAQEALGDDAGAVRRYEEAIALNEQRHGTFVSAHVDLSAYYNRTGDPAKALSYAQKALELDAKCDSAWFQKAKAEERQGQLQAAADSLNRAISVNPRSSSYYYVLAGIYRRLGKTEESKNALDSFTRLDQESNELEKMRRNLSRSRGAPHPGGEREQ